MANKGIEVSFGTDSPIETVNPFNNIFAALTRLSLNNNDNKPYLENEKFSIKEAINHYTHNSSYASFDEIRKGLIKEGYLADILVLDNDLIYSNNKTILKTKISKLIFNGKIKCLDS